MLFLLSSVCSGSTPIIMMVQYFAVFLILSFTGGSLGTTTSPQQQNAANSKDLCEVWKNNTVFLTFLADFSGSEWKKKTKQKKKTLHKKSLLRSIYGRLPVTRTLYISNLPLTQSNFHFPSNCFVYNFTLDNSNSQQLELFSVSLEGSNYRESTVPFEQFIS